MKFNTGGKPAKNQCQCIPLIGPQSDGPLIITNVNSKRKRTKKAANKQKKPEIVSSSTRKEYSEQELEQLALKNVRDEVRVERAKELAQSKTQMSRCLRREYNNTRCKNNFGHLNQDMKSKYAQCGLCKSDVSISPLVWERHYSKIQDELDRRIGALIKTWSKPKRNETLWPDYDRYKLPYQKRFGFYNGIKFREIRVIKKYAPSRSIIGKRKHGRNYTPRFPENEDEEENISFEPQSFSETIVFSLPLLMLFCIIGYHGSLWLMNFYHQSKEIVAQIVDQNLTRVDTMLTRAEVIERTIDNYSNFVNDFSRGNLSQATQLNLVELKTVFHVLYYAYLQDYPSVAAWLSNLAITRSDFVSTLWRSCTLPIAPIAVREEMFPFRFRGRDYTLNVEQLNDVMRMYDQNEDFDHVQNYLDDLRYQFQPQGETNTFLTTLFGHVAKSYLPHLTDKDIREANSKFAYINHQKRDMQDQFETAKIVLSTISLLVFGFDPCDATYQLFASDMISVIKFADQHALKGEEMVSNRLMMQSILDKHVIACELNSHPRMAVIPDFVKKAFTQRFKTLEELAIKCKGYIGSTMEREEPLMVLFTGPPGTGKTATMKFLRQAIALKECGKPYTPEMIYSYNPSNEFWEGYAQQKFVIFDDVWKSTDIKDRRNESTTIISAVNVAPFNLPMAFVKGSNFFNSDYLLASTNLANDGYKTMKPELGVTDPEAVLRRMELIVHFDTKLKGKKLSSLLCRIDKCDILEEWRGRPIVGQRVNVATLALITMECRKIKLEQNIAFDLSTEDVCRMMNLAKLPEEVIREYSTDLDMLESDESDSDVEDVDMPDLFTVVEERDTMNLQSGQEEYIPCKDPSEAYWKYTKEAKIHVDIINTAGNIAQSYVKTSIEDRMDAEIEQEIAIEKLDKRIYEQTEKLLRITDKLADGINSRDPVDQKQFIKDFAALFFVQLDEEQAGWLSYAFLALSGGIASGVLMYTLYGIYTAVSKKEEDFLHVESKPDELRSGKPPKKPSQYGPLQFKRLKLSGHKLEAQSQEDNYYQSLVRRVSKSIVRLYIEHDGGRERAIAWHLKDRIFVAPVHCIIQHLNSKHLSGMYMFNGKEQRFSFGEQVSGLDELDLMVFSVPNGVDVPPALFNYLLPGENDPELPDGTPLKLVTLDSTLQPSLKHLVKQPGKYEVPYTLGDPQLVKKKTRTLEEEEQVHHFTVKFPISYFEDTVSGDSGAIITAEGKQGRVHVVGVHVGRFGQHGISIPITQKMFQNVISTFQPQSIDEIGLVVDRKVEPRYAVHPPTWTKIRRSPLFSWDENPTRFPVKMNKIVKEDGEIFDPLLEAIKGVQQKPKPDTGVPDDVFDYLNKQYPPEKGATVISYEEALNGNPLTGTRSINFGTSPGYPYSLTATGGKAPFIERNGDKLEYSEGFLRELVQFEKALQGNEEPEVLFVDTMKDELRAPGKLPRVFSTCPLNLLMMYRIYFQPFVNSVQRQVNEKPIAVGIDPHSHHWTNLEVRITRFPGSIVAGDYSKFDKSIPKFVGEAAFKFMIDWFKDGETNRKVRWKLAKYVLEAKHLCRDEIYTTQGSNPSGNPITSIYNSLCNLIMMYTVMTRDFGLTTEQFMLIVYGDDNIVASILTHLTTHDVSIFLEARYDLTYTHFSKVPGARILDTIRSIAFLSRSFVKYMSATRAPLPITTIVESTYWYRSGTPLDVAILSTADTFFLELSHHPREVFDDYSTRYLEHAMETTPHLYESLLRRKLLYHDYFSRMYLQNHGTTKLILQSQHVSTTENLQFTDRAMNDVTVTQEVPLGSYQDAAPITASQVNSTVVETPYTGINMETFDLNGSLEREYLIGTMTWTSASGSNTTLAVYNLLQVIRTQPFISDKLKNFKFLVTGVRVSVRGAANRNLLGSCLMYYEPQSDGLPTIPDLFQASGSPHMLFSARSSDAIVMDIPFISPQRALEIDTAGNGELGRITIKVLMPLFDIMGETSNAQFNVFAQFIEPKLFLPHDVITQSGREAKSKGEKGVISGVLEDANTIVGAIEKIGLGNSYTRIFRRIAKPASTGFRMLGLSKPTTVAATQIMKINPNFDLNYGRGIDTSVKLANDPENAISTMTNVGGISEDEMVLKYICGTPKLVKHFMMVAATPSTEVLNLAGGDNSSFVDYLIQMFRFSYGTVKCKVYIWASMFHSVRLVFYFTDSATANWMDCYHLIIDVQGDTTFSVSLPYVGKFVASTRGEISKWHLRVAILSWSEPMPAAGIPIGFSVYKAGASDFQFGGPIETQFIPQSNPREDFVEDFPAIHPSITGFFVENMVWGEEITTLRELVHRYYPIVTKTSTIANYTRLDEGPTQYWRMFRFWRGSLNHRFLYKVNALNDCAYISYGTGVFFGTAIKNANLPQLEFSVPYYNQRLFCETRNGGSDAINVDLSNVPKFWMYGCGDDFSYHFLISPPAGIFAPLLESARKLRDPSQNKDPSGEHERVFFMLKK